MNTGNKHAAEYAKDRISGKWEAGHGGNDRLSREKQDADARLRGQLGARKANELIGAIDEVKYGYNRYK